MPKNTVNRKIEFDYAHRLGNRYKFKCRHNHGHRGVVEVALSYESKNNLDMGIDFAEIKRRVGQWIDDAWDHGTLAAPEDQEYINFLQSENNKLYIMTLGLPTAENMARELFYITKVLMEDTGLVVDKIRFYETPNGFVDCEGLTSEEESLLESSLRSSLLQYKDMIGALEYHV